MKRVVRKRGIRVALLATGLFAVAGGIAYATIPDAGGVYTACKLNITGTIRLIDPSLGSSSLLGHCVTAETQVTWNQGGPTGPKGLTGDKGPTGDQGPVADKGPTGDKGSAGDQGAAGLPGDKGPQGDPGEKGPTGDKGPPGEHGPSAEPLVISRPFATNETVANVSAGPCPAGMHATGGGYTLGSDEDRVTTSAPTRYDGTATGRLPHSGQVVDSWFVRAVDGGSSGLGFTVFVICI